VIAGGIFTRFKTVARNYACAMRISTGEANGWNPSPDYIVYETAWNSSHIYLGGAFDNVNGAARGGIASFNISTGALESWNPQLTLNGTGTQTTVRSIYASSSDVYVGGNFDAANGTTRKNFVNLKVSDATAKSQNPSPDYFVYAIGSNGTQIVLGGQFTFLDNNARNYCAGCASFNR
jgi:hypothetical protein